MRTGSKKLDTLLRENRDRVVIEQCRKHVRIKVRGATVAVLSHGSAGSTKYRTMKNTEARVLRALREIGGGR
jgi:hypothetical protein